MYKDNFNGITVKAILDKRFKKKNDLFSIKIQVIHKRIQKYYNTGKDLTENEWNKLPGTRVANLVKIRNAVKSSYDLIYKSVVDLASQGLFLFDNLNIRLGKCSGETLNMTFQIKIESLKSEERIGTMLYYMNILISIEKFAGKSIPFENINID